MKTIDFSLMVAELMKGEPLVAEILTEIGLGKSGQPGERQVMGNIMTIPRAAAMRGVGFDAVSGGF